LNQQGYQWARPGDVNAFFGLMLDNIAGLVLLVSMLSLNYGFPVDFALAYMVPGTAIGVLVGDLIFFVMAFIYAKSSGRSDVTAMPLGLDTPSTIGMALLVLGPAYSAGIQAGLETQAAAMQTWHIGMCAILITGVIKAFGASIANWIHRVFPRAGLLGSLAAIAIVLIAFNQMPKIGASPIVGLASLMIVFVTLIGRKHLPGKIPGALAAVGLGCLLYYLLLAIQNASGMALVPSAHALGDGPIWLPTEWMEAWKFEWLGAMKLTVPYLGFIVPFAVATVVGGVDCAESAASVGDEFKTSRVIGAEAIATVAAALCGGVIQTTPYIGHPAYKAMGGRAAYVLATALFIGGAGLIGYFSVLFLWIPEAAVLPILIFIGIEITAQSFHATPRRHYAAIAVACIPAIAKLVSIQLGMFFGAIDYSRVPAGDAAFLQGHALVINVLAGGFIFTSLIWASAVAKIIDRRFKIAAWYLVAAAVLVLFGVMHSPLPGDRMFWPTAIFDLTEMSLQQRSYVIQFCIAYLVMAGICFGMSAVTPEEEFIDTDEAFEAL
jgi:AGZA family xanthine/uracil permease-like MFS transporter